MNALRDFFTPGAGQARTNWLNSVLQTYVADPMNYYLGPTGVPGKVQAAGNALEFTDAGDMPAAADAGRRLWNDPSIGNAAEYAAAGAAMMLPFYSARLGEGIADVADELVRGYDPDTAYMFAGPKAKTADHAALAKAQEMAGAGSSRDDIWRDTGWFQGVDGKWRFEIDDSAAQYQPDTDAATVGDVFSHDKLFNAYPDLAGTNYARSFDTNFQGNRAFSGSFDDGIVTIHDELGAKGGRRVMLHELQHVVQDAEGFASGGNPSQFYPEDIINRIQEVDGEADSLLGKSWRAETPELRAELRRQSESLFKEKRALQKQAAQWRFDQYRALSGEAEARGVEARRDFTPDQRRATPPWETMDVPEADQIVRFAGGVQASADPATERAQNVLELLTSGRAADVTDEMLDLGDPVQNARLNMYLFDNGFYGLGE